MKVTKVGVIGCGNIFQSYAKGDEIFHQIKIVGVADIFPEKAKEVEEKYGYKAYATVDDLLKDDEIEIVVNLTIPKVHAEVDKQILNAGKHVFSEKPIACTVEEAKEVVELAKSKGLRVGVAPDTFMGAGIQTCIKLIDEGWIGDVFGVSMNMIGGGPDGWHPNPDFFFKPGAGPMLDMGPYYVTALVSLFGPIESVTGISTCAREKRYITFPVDRIGEYIDVEVPTHNNCLFKLKSGVVANFTCSFDAPCGSQNQKFEVYGTKGTLIVPDPNTYGVPIKIVLPGQEIKEVPYANFNYTGYLRGLGVADMAVAIEEGRPHRANGDMAYHVLEAMLAVYESSDAKKTIDLKTTCDRPLPMVLDLPNGIID